MPDTNITLTDGVSRKEAGFIVLVITLVLTLALAFYKAVMNGDFPSNVTAFLTTLVLTIGAVEALPKAVHNYRR